MHRWTLTALLASAAGLAAWLAPAPSSGTSRVAVDPVSAWAFAPDSADGPVTLAVDLDADAVLRDGSTERYVVVTVTAPAEASTGRLPVDLALVMDVSGSMNSADKIRQAQRAATSLVERLDADDQVSLVTFEDRARTLFTLGSPGRPFADVIDHLLPDGGTNLSAGLDAGITTLRASDRSGVAKKILLLTDGRANLGVTDPLLLRRLAAGSGATLSAIGLGLDYDEGMLSSLADAGGGRYHFVDAATDLTSVYQAELDTASRLVAQENTLEVSFGPEVVPLSVLNWPGSLDAHSATVHLPDLAAGQVRTVVVKVRVDTPASDVVTVAGATLTGRRAGSDMAFTLRSHADAHVVAAPADVDAYVDREASRVMTNAVAGWTAWQANQAWQQGDGERARGLIKEGSGWMRSQRDSLQLAIPETQVQALEALGYVDDGVAQKRALSASRALGGIE